MDIGYTISFPENCPFICHKSLIDLRIIKGGEHLFWVCESQDADWAVKNGYEEIKEK